MTSVNSGSISAGLIVDPNLIDQGGQTPDFLKNPTTVSQPTDGAGAMQCSSQETSDAQQKLQTFWQTQMDEIQNITTNEFKTQELPLARIKKIMKMDDDVKMISAEAPLLFSKAAQIFITELSLRAWIHTEESKRRTLQRNDIATAITKFDQFDFLIDIVPREEIKPAKRSFGAAGSDGVQFFYTVPQQSSGTATTTNSVASLPQGTLPVSALQSGQLVVAQSSQNGQPMTLTPVNLDGSQVLQLSQPAQQSTSTQNLQKQDAAVTVDKTQNAQAVLQQIINSLPNASPGDVHTIQMNSQGQLQLVKMPSSQNQGSGSNGGSQRLVSGGGNQVFEIAANIAGTSQQVEGDASGSGHGVNTLYIGPNN